MTTPRTCIQMSIPPDLRAKADMLSVQENPANGHQISTGGTIQRQGEALSPAPPIGLKWRNGRVLRVRILGGTDKIKAKVRQYAAVWTKHANITFDFVESGDAEIRVNIDSSGASWSYVGTDNLSISQTQPTMNLGWLTDASPEDEFSGVIIHQFGHVLGCTHEHQSPADGVPWNKEAVYAHYATAVGWGREDVDRNIFQLYSSTTTQYSDFDAASIMLFPISPSLTTNGFSVGWNTQLSETDQKFISRAYPGDDERFYVASFNTMQVRPWDQPAKEAQIQTLFPCTYDSPPTLAVGLNWLDVSKDANIRVTAFADTVTPTSANIHINTWADTTLYSAGCTWFPVPPCDPDVQAGQFSTEEDHPWQNPQSKTSYFVAFERAYAAPPTVVVFLNQLDMAQGKNWRVTASATDVSTVGFTLHIDSWDDTVLYSATAAWVAYPRDKPGIASGAYNTQDVRPWDRPQLANSGRVAFAPSGAFERAPSALLIALNSLDVDSAHNLRLKVSADEVSEGGMTWHIDSWGDTVLYSAGASYIAFA